MKRKADYGALPIHICMLNRRDFSMMWYINIGNMQSNATMRI